MGKVGGGGYILKSLPQNFTKFSRILISFVNGIKINDLI